MSFDDCVRQNTKQILLVQLLCFLPSYQEEHVGILFVFFLYTYTYIIKLPVKAGGNGSMGQ